MESKDAYDIALRIGELYFKTVQFFVAICTLFGGWIVTQGLPCSDGARTLVALVFGASAGTLILGQVSLLQRSDAAITLARHLYDKVRPPEADALFAVPKTGAARSSAILGVTAVTIAMLALIALGPRCLT